MILFKALKPILKDFLSTIIFVLCIWITGNIILATVIGITVGVTQTGWMLARRHPIGVLQWISLILVAGLGTTTIITHNGLFFKLKSSIIALVLAGIMLRRQWLWPYLPPIIRDNLDGVTITRAARAWAVMFIALALANVMVAEFCSDRWWAAFIFCVPAISYLALLAAQYRIFHHQIRAGIRERAVDGSTP